MNKKKNINLISCLKYEHLIMMGIEIFFIIDRHTVNYIQTYLQF